jgi:broad specificity phosphatase PhoE
MKTIYCIRHGESEYNEAGLHQGDAGTLTAEGNRQSHAAGKALESSGAQVLVTSPQTRAAETAYLVQKFVDVPLEFLDAARERRNPSEIIGCEKRDPEIRAIKREMDAHYTEPGWRYSDEENFDDMYARVQELVQALTEREEDIVVLVSHEAILKTLAAYALFGDELTARELLAVFKHMTLDNGALVEFTHDEANGWLLAGWNRTAHLSAL